MRYEVSDLKRVLNLESSVNADRMMHDQPVWPALLSGIMATLVGIGLARFAYTPLIPVLIQSGWFTVGEAVYLGAANLLGYLIGALSAHRLTERFAPRMVLAFSLLTIVLSFLLCAWPADFYWFFVWRFCAGLAGAILMVVVPSMALSCTPLNQRTMVGTLMFSGIGIGAVLAAIVIPALLSWNLTITWFALAALALVCGLACDQGVRPMALNSQVFRVNAIPTTNTKVVPIIVVLVISAYALDAVGFVPHTVFWVDYLAREKGFGQTAASLQWALFGVGAVCGPLIANRMVARFGWGASLALVFGLKACAILMPVLSLAWISQSLSSLLVGAFVPAITALTSGRLAEIVGPARHKQAWGQATAAFAAAQALSGYLMSAAYGVLGSYTPLYVIASALLALGALLIVTSSRYRCGG